MVIVISNHMANYGLSVLEHLECVRHFTNKFEDGFIEGKDPSKCLGTVIKQVVQIFTILFYKLISLPVFFTKF